MSATSTTSATSASATNACTCSSCTSVLSVTATALRASYAAEVSSSGISNGLHTYVAAATSDHQPYTASASSCEHLRLSAMPSAATAFSSAPASQRHIRQQCTAVRFSIRSTATNVCTSSSTASTTKSILRQRQRSMRQRQAPTTLQQHHQLRVSTISNNVSAQHLRLCGGNSFSVQPA